MKRHTLKRFSSDGTGKKRRKLPVRIPCPKPTEWHKDKTKYNRRKKHKKGDIDDSDA